MAFRVRTAGIRASRVRAAAVRARFGVARRVFEHLGVRLLSICDFWVRGVSIQGRFSRLDGQGPNPRCADGQNPHPRFPFRLRTAPSRHRRPGLAPGAPLGQKLGLRCIDGRNPHPICPDNRNQHPGCSDGRGRARVAVVSPMVCPDRRGVGPTARRRSAGVATGPAACRIRWAVSLLLRSGFGAPRRCGGVPLHCIGTAMHNRRDSPHASGLR